VEWQPDWPASEVEVDEWARGVTVEGLDDPGVLQMIRENRPLTAERIERITAEQDELLARDPRVSLFERVAKMRGFRLGMEHYAALDEINQLPEDDGTR
jgi:hypothetical protein